MARLSEKKNSTAGYKSQTLRIRNLLVRSQTDRIDITEFPNRRRSLMRF
jgi:hypothetical protein